MAVDTYKDNLAFVLEWEGGTFTDDPDDKGGPTKWGVIQTRYDQYRKSVGKKTQSVRYIIMLEVEAIYRTYYWNPISGDKLPAIVDLAVFDAAVNNGPDRAAKWLQKVLGVTADGQIGQATLAATDNYVAKHGAKQLATAICDRREEFYEDIAVGRQHKWLKGWMNRLNSLRKKFGLVDTDGPG